MANNISSIEYLCSKSNLVVEKKVKDKAVELSQLLEARAGSTSLSALRLAGLCRHIICIDLAATYQGCTMNRADVVRLSGMSQRSYNEARGVIASMLGLEEHVTLRELAVKFGCPRAVSLATKILHSYVADQYSDVDFYAPMFLCAALVVACRKLKMKIGDVRKIREQSGTRQSTLNTLIKQLEKYADKIKDEEGQSKPNKTKKRGFMDTVESIFQEDNMKAKRAKLVGNSNADDSKKKVTSTEYEEWKRKILAKAGQASS